MTETLDIWLVVKLISEIFFFEVISSNSLTKSFGKGLEYFEQRIGVSVDIVVVCLVAQVTESEMSAEPGVQDHRRNLWG